MRPLLFALALATASAPALAAPRLDAPADLNGGDPAPLRLSGLKPGQVVELVSTRRANGAGQPYGPPVPKAFIAHATFRADARGRVDLASAAPLAGDYAGADRSGLFWSAREARAPEADDPAAGRVRVQALVDGKVAAATELRTTPDRAALIVEPVPGFPGAQLIRPAGPGRRPVVITLGGSEGGSGTSRAFAARFAALGYAALALPYYDTGYDPSDKLPGLPRTFQDIPADRLVAVRDWLAGRPEADTDRIGVWGGSKGAEFALIAASRLPWIKAVAAVVPSDVVWEGWGKPGSTASFAWDGKPLAYLHYQGMDEEIAKAAKGQPMNLRRVHDAGRKAFPDELAAARIPVERFTGPVVLIGGGEDQVWPSADMAKAMSAARRRAGLPTVLVVEPKAGHGLGGPGYDPAAPLSALGGEPEANARARRLGWKATVETFARTLHPERS